MKLLSILCCYLLYAIVNTAMLTAGQGKLPEQVKEAFKNGNAKVISGYCCEKVELSILGKDGQYNKEKLVEVLKDFFSKNVPRLFVIIFEGGKESSQYVIGKLTTDKDSYRINLLINNGIIQQLKIELYNED